MMPDIRAQDTEVPWEGWMSIVAAVPCSPKEETDPQPILGKMGQAHPASRPEIPYTWSTINNTRAISITPIAATRMYFE